MSEKDKPTLAEVHTWFAQTVVPKRSAGKGFSLNRVWKSPMSFVTGNEADPNGLCGDAALHVANQFFETFNDDTTSDGYQIGMVLWKEGICNHMANVMLLKSVPGSPSFTYDVATNKLKVQAKSSAYNEKSFMTLEVLDLYYQEAAKMHQWWKKRSAQLSGIVRIGRQHDFAN